MVELLVELLAQPAELLRVAELVGLDHLVELGGVGAVAAGIVGALHLTALLRAAGLVVALGGGALILALLGLLLRRLALHRLGLGAEHAFLVLGLGLALPGLVLLGGLLAALLAILLVLALGLHLGFGEVERGQQLAGGTREGVLVLGRRGHFLKRGLGILGQRIAPEIEHALRRLGHRLAGQSFADQQGQRGGQRQLILARHPVITVGFALIGEAGAQIGGDARHMLAAQHLDAHILQRVEHLPRLTPLRQAGIVDVFGVVPQLESGGIRRAAQLGHFSRR